MAENSGANERADIDAVAGGASYITPALERWRITRTVR
jgi:hypothetical protein